MRFFWVGLVLVLFSGSAFAREPDVLAKDEQGTVVRIKRSNMVGHILPDGERLELFFFLGSVAVDVSPFLEVGTCVIYDRVWDENDRERAANIRLCE